LDFPDFYLDFPDFYLDFPFALYEIYPTKICQIVTEICKQVKRPLSIF
jgi:hypothetical protein